MNWRRAFTVVAVGGIALFVWKQPFAAPAGDSESFLLTTPTVSTSPAPVALEVRAGAAAITIPAPVRRRWADAAPEVAAARARRWVGAHAERINSGRVTIRLAWSMRAIRRLVATSRTTTRSVSLPARVASVQLQLPAIKQVYRNDCEAAALSILLRGAIDQRRLQQQLPVAAPVSRESLAGGPVWGDPQMGFVGDVRGGGYGVYDRPLLRLARRYDPGATDLTGRPFSALVTSIAHTRPVIAWIALGPSHPATWRTPAGTTIMANFAEHTIVLTGVRDQTVTYIDPWDGTDKQTSFAQLRLLWATLGARAIAGSPLSEPSTGR